jgi:hypothetical protein
MKNIAKRVLNSFDAYLQERESARPADFVEISCLATSLKRFSDGENSEKDIFVERIVSLAR